MSYQVMEDESQIGHAVSHHFAVVFSIRKLIKKEKRSDDLKSQRWTEKTMNILGHKHYTHTQITHP